MTWCKLTITREAVGVKPVTCVAAASITADIVVTVLVAAISSFSTLINVVTTKTIGIQPITSIATTGVRADVVVAVLHTLISALRAFIHV